MGNENHGMPAQHGESAISTEHTKSPKGIETPVSEVCDTALRALFEFTAVIGDSAWTHSAVARAKVTRLRLDKALLRALFEPCGTVSDGRAKCIVFQQLRRVFPPEDKRLHDFAIHVLAEISVLLIQSDRPTSSDESSIMCSCGKDSVADQSIRNPGPETASGS